MRKTTAFLWALSAAFLFAAGDPPALAAHALRDLSPAESAPKRSGIEEALGLPDEEDLLETAVGSWQARVKQGNTVNPDALWVVFGNRPSDQTERQGLLAALHETPGDVFIVEDKFLNGRPAWRGEMGLWIGEEAARQAGAVKLIPALQTGDFSSISAVREPEEKPPPEVSLPPAPAAKPAAAPAPAGHAPKPERPAPKTPAPAPKTTPPEPTAAEPEKKPKERPGSPFLELLEEILDPSAAHRNDRNWSDLVDRLFTFYERDEKPDAFDSPGRKVRLTALRAYRRVANWPNLSVKEILGKARGEMGPALMSGGEVQYRERLAEPERIAREAATIALKVWETAEEDKRWGVPLTPRPLDGALPIPEYLRRFRERLIFDSRGKEMTEVPVYTLGFLGQPNRDVEEPEPLGILSLLAARQIGQVPTTRSFPESAEGLLNGVERIEYLPPVPGGPPSLRIHFRKGRKDLYSEIEYQVIVAALLKEPWPEVPAGPSKPWGELSDDELIESAALSMERELQAVEFSEEKVRSFALGPEASLPEQTEKVFTLLHLAEQGLLVTRSQYTIEIRKPEWERLARWMARDPKSRAATLKFMTLLGEKTDLGAYERVFPRVAPQQREEFLRRADVRSQAIGLLAGLGLAAEEVFDPAALQRAEEVVLKLGAKGRPFSLQTWELYAPLLRLVIARKEEPQRDWLLSPEDVTTVLNRIAKFRSSLLEKERLDLLRAAAGALSGLDRQFFLREMNRLVLRAIPVKPERPFRSATMEEAERALEESPLLSGLAAWDKRQEELLRGAESLREAVWRHLEAEEPSAGAMEKGIAELEETLREARSSAVFARIDAPRVSLEDPSLFAAALERIKPAPVEESRPAELDLYRDLLEPRRALDSGKIQEALDQIMGLLPKFEGPSAGRLQRFRERLEEQAAAIEKQRREDLKRKRREEAEAASRQRGEPGPAQKAAAAMLGNPAYRQLLSDPQVLSERALKLLKQLASTGVADRDKVASLLRAPAKARIRQPQVQASSDHLGLYRALLEVAEKFDEAQPDGTQAGAEEIKEILDAAGVPTSGLPDRHQRQLDRDL